MASRATGGICHPGEVFAPWFYMSHLIKAVHAIRVVLPVFVLEITVTPFWGSWEAISSLCHWDTQLSVLESVLEGHWILGFCPSWGCSSRCSCSKHSANFTWPRDRAIASGSLPRESGIEMARRSHLYSTTAASMWPRAHAHIWKNKQTKKWLIGKPPFFLFLLMQWSCTLSSQKTDWQNHAMFEHHQWAFINVLYEQKAITEE